MKVTFTIELDMPDTDMSDGMLRQALFDEYVNYVTVNHICDEARWTASRARYESAGDMSMVESADGIIARHATWSEIAKSAKMGDIKRNYDRPRKGSEINLLPRDE